MSILESKNLNIDLLAVSTDSTFADVALPCHSLSKILKGPNEISDEILENLVLQPKGLSSWLRQQLPNFSAEPDWLGESTRI